MAKGQNIKVDFSNVEGGGRSRVPEGDYIVKVVSCKHETAQSGNPMLVWRFAISDGKFEGKPLYTNTVLVPKALWVLRNLLEAMGLKVPSKSVNLNPAKFVGKELGVTVQDNEFEGRTYSEIVDYVSPDAVTGEDVEEEEELDEEEEDLEDEDLEELDLDEM